MLCEIVFQIGIQSVSDIIPGMLEVVLGD